MPLGMAGGLETVGVKAVVDGFKPYMAQLGQMEAKTKGFGSKIGSFLKMGALVGGAALIGLGAAALKLGGEFDKAYDKIQIGTGATGSALEDLKKDFKAALKDLPAGMGDVSTAVADLNTRLGLTGKPLQKMTKQMVRLSDMTETDLSTNIEQVTRVFGDWGVETKNQSKSLDKLFKVSQAAGPSVDQIGRLMVQYGAPMRQFGFSFEEAAVLMGKFEREGVNTELVMGALRIGLVKLAKSGEPLPEAFRRVVDEIKNAGGAAEANTLAVEIFGARAGPDMAAAIREGRFEIEELIGQLGDSEGAILDTAAATDDWIEKLQMLKNKVLVALEPLLIGMFDRLTDLATVIETRTIPALKAWWQDHGPKVIGVADAMKEGILLLKDATLGLGNWIINNKAALVTAIAAVGLAFAWTNPGGVVLIGLATAITLIGTMRQDIKKLPEPLLEVRKQIDKLVLATLNFDEAMLHILDYLPADVLGLKTPITDLREHINDLKANVVADMDEIGYATDRLNRNWQGSASEIREQANQVRLRTDHVATGFTEMGGTLATETPPMLGRFQSIIDRIKGVPTERKVTLQVDDALFYGKITNVGRALAGVPGDKKVRISVDGADFWTEARNISAYIQSLRAAQVRFDITQLRARAASYQHGAWDIPRKMLAELHPGEMVLPRPQAEVVREAVLAPSVAPQAAAAMGGGVDPSALAAAVASALQGMTVQMDGRVVGNLVSERLGGQSFMLGRGG